MINFLKSLFWMLVVWSIIYGFEIYKGWTINNLFLQTIFCTFFFLNALVSVPHYESREITYRILNSKAFDLYEGLYFFPLLGLWGQVYIPPEYKTEEKSQIHFDSRQVLRHRQITSKLEDFLISFIFPMFRKFKVWDLCLCLILGLGLAWCSLKVNQTFFNPKTEIANQNISNEQPQIRQGQNLDEVLKKIPAREREELRKMQKEVEENQNSSSPASSSANVNSNDWQPDRPYISNFTWDNLLAADRYSVNINLAKGISYVDIKGNFVWHYNSKNYYPHIYVDGYNEDQDYFYNFFTVYVRKITTVSGATWNNSNVELSDYIAFVKNKSNFSDQCYRDIRISLKPQFIDKVRWHIIDAGWGINEPFKISLEDQYMTSLFDSQKFGIPMYKIN